MFINFLSIFQESILDVCPPDCESNESLSKIVIALIYDFRTFIKKFDCSLFSKFLPLIF